MECCKFGDLHPIFEHVYEPFDVRWKESPKQIGNTSCGAFVIRYVDMLMQGKDVKTIVPNTIKYYREYHGFCLWGQAEWKHKSGYETPPEMVGDEYGDNGNNFCKYPLAYAKVMC